PGRRTTERSLRNARCSDDVRLGIPGGPKGFRHMASRLGHVNRRAKIVCTLGPAVDGPERLRELVAAGMDVARLNFSHGAHAEHERRYHGVREAAAASGRPIGILADLQGPKI